MYNIYVQIRAHAQYIDCGVILVGLLRIYIYITRIRTLGSLNITGRLADCCDCFKANSIYSVRRENGGDIQANQ